MSVLSHCAHRARGRRGSGTTASVILQKVRSTDFTFNFPSLPVGIL